MNRISALLAVAASVALMSAAPGVARADEQACLSKSDQRAAISNGQAMPLAAAMNSVRSVRTTKRTTRGSKEVIKARLCREAKGLVYVLTLLAGDGKVTHASVDATSGKIVDVR